MRWTYVFAGWGLATSLGIVGACGSSDDSPAQQPTPEAGIDSSGPQPEGGGTDGGPDGGSGLEHSGTRLLVQGITTSEGTFVGIELYDTKLGTRCYAAPTEDGVVRCIPGDAISAPYYADDKCTTVLAETTKGSCSVPTFGARRLSSTPCDTRASYFRLGAKVTPAKLYVKSGVDCNEQAPAPDGEYYAVTAALAPSELVTLTAKDIPVTAKLAVHVVDGDDGSRYRRDAFFDVARGKSCRVNRGGDDQLRCTPASSANADWFSDVGCGNRAALGALCNVVTEPFDDTTAQQFELGACGPNKVRAYALGAKRGSRDIYSQTPDGGCSGPTTSSQQEVFDVGAEIAASTFPKVDDGTTGGPRIVEKTYTSEGVLLANRRIVRDTTLGIDCAFQTAADGKTRCLPQDLYAAYYLDDQCTIPLAPQTEACKTPKYALAQEGTCATQTTRVYTLGATIDPTTTPYYIRTSSNCQQVGGSNSLTLYRLGTEVPASSFVEGTATKR